jgi:hypothetical protein
MDRMTPGADQLEVRRLQAVWSNLACSNVDMIKHSNVKRQLVSECLNVDG